MKRLLSIAIACAVALPAAAYVPTARGIIRRFAEMQALERTTPSPLLGSARFGSRPYDYAVDFDVSRTGCRASMKTAQGTVLDTLADGKMSATGPSVLPLEAMVALGCPLLMFKNQPASDVEDAVIKYALSIGVDVTVASLSRVNPSPVARDVKYGYVIGAKPGDSTHPQIWFDSATNRPLRIIARYQNRLWDVRFVDGGSIATNRLAPRTAAVYADGTRQMDLRLMAANPSLAGEAAAEMEDEGE